MNKYLEKIAGVSSLRSYPKYNAKKKDLVETALNIKGRAEDINSLHSKFKENRKRKKK